MRRVLTLFLIVSQSTVLADTLSGRVISITDGDTINVLDTNRTQHKIRLSGIDAPEHGQAFGTKSKQHLADMIAGKAVIIEYDKYDRYGRIVGKILLDDKDVNLEQVKTGMAWHYKQYQNEQSYPDRLRYARAENNARDDMI